METKYHYWNSKSTVILKVGIPAAFASISFNFSTTTENRMNMKAAVRVWVLISVQTGLVSKLQNVLWFLCSNYC